MTAKQIVPKILLRTAANMESLKKPKSKNGSKKTSVADIAIADIYANKW
jgi:hypothetical protein